MRPDGAWESGGLAVRGMVKGVDQDAACCWLCGRALGGRTEWQHPVPRSRGGRAVVALHPICHRAIHANFTNAQLARSGDALSAMWSDPGVARFLAWIADKPPDFHARTASRRRRGR